MDKYTEEIKLQVFVPQVQKQRDPVCSPLTEKLSGFREEILSLTSAIRDAISRVEV